MIQAEKIFWEQEANSLSARLYWESNQRNNLATKYSQIDLENKTMKEEIKQTRIEFETKILQNNEMIASLSQKVDSTGHGIIPEPNNLNPLAGVTKIGLENRDKQPKDDNFFDTEHFFSFM